MKRMIALVFTILLLGLTAFAEPMSYLDYTDGQLEDGSPVYYFTELSLTLPSEWQGKVFAIPEDGRTAFYQTASYDKYQAEGLDGGGFLFALGTSVNGSFSQLPAFEYLGFSEESMLNYYLELPSDYPAYMGDETIRAEYDAMYAQMDEVTAGVTFYADGTDHPEAGGTGPNDAAEMNGSSGTGNVVVSLERMRYHFEHSALPRYFYEDPANMLDVLKDSSVYKVWTLLADENGVAYPWQESDFCERWYDADDGTRILQIEMPAPEETPQCYRIYMVYNDARGSAGYYTIEYENLLGETAFTCGWTADLAHMNYGGAAVLDPDADDYEAALQNEAQQIAQLAGVSGSVRPAGQTGANDTGSPESSSTERQTGSGGTGTQNGGGGTGTQNGGGGTGTQNGGGSTDGLALIECPQLGFTTMADPSYAWDYQEGTGISIYTEHAGNIPYVIVWRSEDLIAEPLDYIKEQFTPHMQSQYGDDLVSYVEYEFYDIGGKQLPAGLYTYRLQGYLIDMLRIYDSTGERTAAYTAKYIQGQGDATLAALDTAIRNFRAE